MNETRLRLRHNKVHTDRGFGLEILIAGFPTEHAAEQIADKIRRLLQENTQAIFGHKFVLPS